MAKKDKAEKPDTKGKDTEKAEKATEREFKYGVADLAEQLDLEPASVRVKLRNADIAKAGKAYGWNSKKELEEVAAQLKSEKADKPKATKKPKKGEEPAAEEGEGKKKDKKDKKGKKNKKDKSED